MLFLMPLTNLSRNEKNYDKENHTEYIFVKKVKVISLIWKKIIRNHSCFGLIIFWRGILLKSTQFLNRSAYHELPRIWSSWYHMLGCSFPKRSFLNYGSLLKKGFFNNFLVSFGVITHSLSFNHLRFFLWKRLYYFCLFQDICLEVLAYNANHMN